MKHEITKKQTTKSNPTSKPFSAKILTTIAAISISSLTITGCNTFRCYDTDVVKKPVIYLYPTEDNTPIDVQLNFDGEFTQLDPEFNTDNGWSVVADSAGQIRLNEDTYPNLFWEGIPNVEYTIEQGFCVSGNDTQEFLEDKLEYIGLSDSEIADFIDYWEPILKENPYNIISFETGEYASRDRLEINPAPDSVIEVMMKWDSSDTPVDIEQQDLQHYDRCGFTVVEWGGVQVNY